MQIDPVQQLTSLHTFDCKKYKIFFAFKNFVTAGETKRQI